MTDKFIEYMNEEIEKNKKKFREFSYDYDEIRESENLNPDSTARKPKKI